MQSFCLPRAKVACPLRRSPVIDPVRSYGAPYRSAPWPMFRPAQADRKILIWGMPDAPQGGEGFHPQPLPVGAQGGRPESIGGSTRGWTLGGGDERPLAARIYSDEYAAQLLEPPYPDRRATSDCTEILQELHGLRGQTVLVVHEHPSVHPIGPMQDGTVVVRPDLRDQPTEHAQLLRTVYLKHGAVRSQVPVAFQVARRPVRTDPAEVARIRTLHDHREQVLECRSAAPQEPHLELPFQGIGVIDHREISLQRVLGSITT